MSKLFSRLMRNEDGVGAVEFALLVPVLLVLYIGAVELSFAMSVNTKMAKANAVATDIIALSKTTDEATLQEMVGVAKSILAPFDSSGLDMEIIGITVDATGTSTVAWSWDEENNRPLTVGDPITIPAAFAIPNTFLLRTTVNLPYNLKMLAPKDHADIEWETASINMEKIYYLHQREAEVITCSDC